MDYSINEHKPKYDIWFKLVLAIPLCALLVTAIALYSTGSSEALAILVVFVFILLVFWLIIPRKYLVMSDRLKLVMGASLAFNIHYRDVKEIRKPGTWSFGVNYITSLKTPLEIAVKKGMNINISPEDRQAFLEDINRAIQEWRRSNNINDQSD